MLTVPLIEKSIAEVVADYQITKVDLFGSYAKGTAKEDSDIDLLVEFTKPAVSLITLASLKYALEEKLNTKVDVIHGPLESDSFLILGKLVPLYERQG